MTEMGQKVLDEIKDTTPFGQYFDMLGTFYKRNDCLLNVRVTVKNACMTIEWLQKESVTPAGSEGEKK